MGSGAGHQRIPEILLLVIVRTILALLQLMFLSRFGLIFFSWPVVKLPLPDWCAWVKRHLESERKLVGSEFLSTPVPVLAIYSVR